jgi:hypothetical protein
VSSASSHSERFREVDSVPTARIPFRHAGSVEAPGRGRASPEGEWTIRAASASCAHVLCMFSCAHEPPRTDRPRSRHSATAHADQHGRPRLGCSARCRAARRRGRGRARCRRLAASVSSRLLGLRDRGGRPPAVGLMASRSGADGPAAQGRADQVLRDSLKNEPTAARARPCPTTSSSPRRPAKPRTSGPRSARASAPSSPPKATCWRCSSPRRWCRPGSAGRPCCCAPTGSTAPSPPPAATRRPS